MHSGIYQNSFLTDKNFTPLLNAMSERRFDVEIEQQADEPLLQQYQDLHPGAPERTPLVHHQQSCKSRAALFLNKTSGHLQKKPARSTLLSEQEEKVVRARLHCFRTELQLEHADDRWHTKSAGPQQLVVGGSGLRCINRGGARRSSGDGHFCTEEGDVDPAAQRRPALSVSVLAAPIYNGRMKKGRKMRLTRTKGVQDSVTVMSADALSTQGVTSRTAEAQAAIEKACRFRFSEAAGALQLTRADRNKKRENNSWFSSRYQEMVGTTGTRDDLNDNADVLPASTFYARNRGDRSQCGVLFPSSAMAFLDQSGGGGAVAGKMLSNRPFTTTSSSLIQMPDPRNLTYDSGKLQVLKRLLQQCYSKQNRVLLFTQFGKMLDILEEFLAVHNYTYSRLDGKTSNPDRQKLVDDFNEKPNTFIMLSSTRAGGIGLNLTGANVVIFYDSDWNPATDRQAMDRVHRIGQLKDVHVFRLLSSFTVEENIWRKQVIKRKLDDMVIDEGQFQHLAKGKKKGVDGEQQHGQLHNLLDGVFDDRALLGRGSAEDEAQGRDASSAGGPTSTFDPLAADADFFALEGTMLHEQEEAEAEDAVVAQLLPGNKHTENKSTTVAEELKTGALLAKVEDVEDREEIQLVPENKSGTKIPRHLALAQLGKKRAIKGFTGRKMMTGGAQQEAASLLIPGERAGQSHLRNSTRLSPLAQVLLRQCGKVVQIKKLQKQEQTQIANLRQQARREGMSSFRLITEIRRITMPGRVLEQRLQAGGALLSTSSIKNNATGPGAGEAQKEKSRLGGAAQPGGAPGNINAFGFPPHYQQAKPKAKARASKPLPDFMNRGPANLQGRPDSKGVHLRTRASRAKYAAMLKEQRRQEEEKGGEGADGPSGGGAEK
ncbi:unnamed protein product [Amoebophrya sp. A120]|nr:unnamed protein product [Amoebophrya sp. A120]|eukprot:GSA120T00019860001.1